MSGEQLAAIELEHRLARTEAALVLAEKELKEKDELLRKALNALDAFFYISPEAVMSNSIAQAISYCIDVTKIIRQSVGVK